MPLSWLRRIWHYLSPTQEPGQPCYVVTCRCGQVLRGSRRPTHQIHRCPRCGQNVFILPQRAFEPPNWEAPKHRPPLAPANWLPLFAPGFGLAALALVTLIVLWLPPSPRRQAAENKTPRQTILDRFSQGQQEIQRGGKHLAREYLEEALRLRDATPELLAEPEHRQLNQLQRQVALLTDLTPGGLLAVLDQAERAPSEMAWKAQFRADYQGRGILLDDLLRVTPDRAILGRQYSDMRTGEAFGRVAFEDLKLLQDLPLQAPQRWILGARLKSVDREGGASWIVRLEPSSGVLFSERALLESELPALKGDPEWAMLLTRQQALLETLPSPRPHR